ncbi:MAG: TRAP transporter TatT component family protein [Spirochaetales bacterium]|nr:TRAP transporter TatT component family protein [Spirochaetales bacterium]MCF7939361.1 TRAP transporter TatT component family protein [Spirochaetales bacterium]
MKKRFVLPLFILVVLLTVGFSGCSIQEMAVSMVADALTSGASDSFSSDEDPELVGDALPFALKLYEILLEKQPDHQGLHLSAGSGFVMYTNAYIHTPATMLPAEKWEKQEEMLARAQRMYLRGRDLVMDGLELRYPGFLDSMDDQESFRAGLEKMTEEDVPSLYWAGAGWMGAFAANSFDYEVSMGIPLAGALMQRALELDEDFRDGAIHDFFINYYGALPEAMGGSEEKARYHFQQAVELSEGRLASPYVALASTVSVRNQDEQEFRRLMSKAAEIDLDVYPEQRLVNTLKKEQAQWYLEHIEDFILIDTGEEDEWENEEDWSTGEW